MHVYRLQQTPPKRHYTPDENHERSRSVLLLLLENTEGSSRNIHTKTKQKSYLSTGQTPKFLLDTIRKVTVKKNNQ